MRFDYFLVKLNFIPYRRRKSICLMHNYHFYCETVQNVRYEKFVSWSSINNTKQPVRIWMVFSRIRTCHCLQLRHIRSLHSIRNDCESSDFICQGSAVPSSLKIRLTKILPFAILPFRIFFVFGDSIPRWFRHSLFPFAEIRILQHLSRATPACVILLCSFYFFFEHFSISRVKPAPHDSREVREKAARCEKHARHETCVGIVSC